MHDIASDTSYGISPACSPSEELAFKRLLTLVTKLDGSISVLAKLTLKKSYINDS